METKNLLTINRYAASQKNKKGQLYSSVWVRKAITDGRIEPTIIGGIMFINCDKYPSFLEVCTKNKE